VEGELMGQDVLPRRARSQSGVARFGFYDARDPDAPRP
jgi:hypothetical protein